MIFFIAGTLQKNMFFVIPIPFRTYTKHFRRFLNSFWSSAEQRWFRENQRWTALKQRWSALVFLTHSETALISVEIYNISETTLFSADLLWDFNPGYFFNFWVANCPQAFQSRKIVMAPLSSMESRDIDIEIVSWVVSQRFVQTVLVRVWCFPNMLILNVFPMIEAQLQFRRS